MEPPGIEPGSFAISPGLLRAQSAQISTRPSDSREHVQMIGPVISKKSHQALLTQPDSKSLKSMPASKPGTNLGLTDTRSLG